ncbi:EAL domain-containing protein [Rhodoplanes sp. TEM]|uniref:EAL domain-containing protein n=1 Tax=Rhodoplanes tepidamans TaxID=200616 RepID=A0ABT5JAX8_RHOTP|nr:MULTISPECIES: EAL domain-containing protein [Rhodoplanes]MDC7786841.1 EAL domain-containing protein [Rhodoplanes tepidamans]MDC7984230.1 EAL domain-containing protein [Rhodoplanes sp. TEM]MDQ0355969.1 diguanylate cyclase (GGDEF)-like protein/PAS domain S-box-containing protein [Rhodoplanes tepidamans]
MLLDGFHAFLVKATPADPPDHLSGSQHHDTEGSTEPAVAAATSPDGDDLAIKAFEAASMGLALLDHDDRHARWNSRYVEIVSGQDGPSPAGLTFEAWLRVALAAGIYADAVGREEDWLRIRMALHRREDSTHEHRLANGRWLRVEERRTTAGTLVALVDITDMKRREHALGRLFDSNPIALAVLDRASGRYLAVNDATTALYGYGRAELLMMTAHETGWPDPRRPGTMPGGADADSEGDWIWRHRRADGAEIDVCVYARPIAWENRPAMLVALLDVTERRRQETHITHLAHHDALTDLANRTLFHQRLEKALARERDPNGSVALHCVDLDHFKNVNDSLGHPVGDGLLRIVAERLRRCVRQEDTVARIGGDEFAVIQEGVCAPQEASALAIRVIESLSAPYVINGNEIQLSASIGIALATSPSHDPNDLLTQADIALYQAKGGGRRAHCFFAPEMDVQLKARRALEVSMRAAYARDEFEVHYQPWIDLASNRIEGFEALLRWTHPENGPIGPAEFIPLAEEIGLISAIGERVLHQACTEAAKWPNHVFLAINLSPVQFRSGGLVQSVHEALVASGLPAHRLELEVTETLLLEDNNLIRDILYDLRNMGVRIVMDDFGTGYSSLSYLRRFPFSKIKIDRSFVRELPHDLDCVTIVHGIVELANGLGMMTTAEGVETPEQLYVLRGNGCTHAQGHLFGAAMPAPQAATLLREETRITA